LKKATTRLNIPPAPSGVASYAADGTVTLAFLVYAEFALEIWLTRVSCQE
jgi:hypothetical protein